MFDEGLHQFLAELADNNEKPWFEANRARYNETVKGAALRFIEAMEPHLAEVSPEITAVAKVQGGSMFRIHRDVRFSKDKRPFKTHVGLWFKHTAGKMAPGFYLGMEATSTTVGAGLFGLEKEQLASVRDAIVARPEAWSTVRASLDEGGFAMMGRDSALKRAPKGYDAGHAHIEDLRLKRFAASKDYGPEFVTQPTVLTDYVDAVVPVIPLVEFLCEALDLPF